MPGEFVVDASVLVKCLVDEEDSGLARMLLSGGAHRLAPEFIFAELASVASKKVRQAQLQEFEGLLLLRRAGALIDELSATGPLSERAFQFAVAQGFSAYDGLYLALAEGRSTRVLTADVKLARRAADAGLSPLVELLAAAPA